MARASLPPGFRFHPTDVELILYYLKRKVLGKRLVIDAITDLDLYKFSPWDLPDKSCLRSRDLEWYFFCPKDKKYAQGVRTNRATEIGYWKTTGRDRPICNETHTVGMKKTLIFHLGRAPLGKRTNWVMHEYRLEIKDLTDAGILQDSYVLCKIFEKSGAGPKNGEQHGAPFKEEEWEDNLVENSLAPLPLVDSSFPSIFLDDKKNIVSEDSTFSLEKTCESSFQHPCQDVSSDTSRENQFMLDNVDMDYIFTLLEAENDPRLIGNDSIKMSESNYRSNIEAPPPSNGNDIFGDLEDHKTMTKLNGTDHLDLTKMSDGNVLGQTLLMNGMAYVELDDFDSPMKYPVNGDGPNHIQYENSRSKLEIGTGDKLTLSSEDVCSIRLSDLDIPEKYSWKPVNGDGPKHIQYENSRSKLEIGTEDKLALSSENVCSIRSSDFDVPEKYPCEVTSETFFSGHQFSCNSDVSLEGFSPMETVHLHPVSGTGLSACIVHKDSSAPLFNLDVASSAATSGVGSSRCVLHKDSGAVDCLDVASNDHSGFEGTSVSWYEDPKQTPEIHLGGRLNTNTQRTSSRGEHHSGNSRLHRLLGSIPAPAASAAEFPLSINAGKGSKGNSLFTNHGGSSIHVKAEVSVRCGCTEEALSGKLGEFPYLCCCGLQFPRKELKKVATACSSGFTFVFLLGVVTALVWLLIFTIVVKVGWSAWKLIIS